MRKGLGIGRGSGYYNLVPKDPMIHSLSARGVKTRCQFMKKTLMAEGNKGITKDQITRFKELTENFTYYDLSAEDLKEIEDDVKNELTAIEEHDSKRDGWLTLKFGDEEWTLAPSEDDAIEMAKEQVREDLENEPELFEANWLEGHIDTDNLKDQLEDDVSNMNNDYYNDIADEPDDEYGNRQVQELVDGGYLDWDEYKEKKEDVERLEEDEKPNQELINKIKDEMEDLVNDAVEEAVEKKTEEDLDDPMEYLEGLYGKDYVKEAIRIGGIDYDEATEDAIDTDGWQHFISRYDEGSTDLKSGKVIWREN